jgi:branched-chain amino acid transport system permease protein
MDDYLIGVLSNVGVISFIALSAYLLLLVGEISFGQQAFFAIGAYAAGIATALWQWPLWLGLAAGAAAGAGAAMLVGVPTLRLHGLYFAIATLAFAEMVRILFELFRYQILIDGELAGPNGADGFRDIRYIFENDIGPVQFMLLIYALLAAILLGFAVLERSRLILAFRMIGEDDVLAEMHGIAVARYKVLAAGMAGALAGIGGGLYAHLTTYVEPRIFDVMLGVHGLAYGLIGGLGTALGPLLGVVIDIGVLESIRWLAGYRMIVFGGLVAVLLIWRPRGLLDEVLVNRVRLAVRRACRRPWHPGGPASRNRSQGSGHAP